MLKEHGQESGVSIPTQHPPNLSTGPLSLMGLVSVGSVLINQPWPPWLLGQCSAGHSTADRAKCHQHTGDTQDQNSMPARQEET